MKVDVLWQGDCIELMRGIPDGSVDCIVTDIPYNETDRRSNSGLRNIHKGEADKADFDLLAALREMDRVCKGSFYIFCGYGQISAIHEYFLGNGITDRLMTWEKTNPSPMNGDRLWLFGTEPFMFARKPKATFNLHCANTVLKHKIVSPKPWHPTEKPVGLLQQLVEASTNKGDIVLDPFMGGGSTCIAALRSGRRYIGIERNKEWYSNAVRRLELEMNQEPK